MDDQTDAFARLKRLHVEGVLSDAEYERAKAGLMGNVSPVQPSLREHWAAGREATGGIRRSLRWSLIGCVVVVALIGTYFFGKARTLAEARGEIAGTTQASDDASVADKPLFGSDNTWTFESTTDPMTDATVNQASGTFEGHQFNVQVSVSCSSVGDIKYTATSFDKGGKAAEMRSQANWERSWIPFQIRADDGQAISWSTNNPPYNNQVTLASSPVSPVYGSSPEKADEIAAASKVALRLFMSTGEETIEWSQADPAFRNLMTPCLLQRQAERDRLTAEQAKKEREDVAEQARAGNHVVNAM